MDRRSGSANNHDHHSHSFVAAHDITKVHVVAIHHCKFSAIFQINCKVYLISI